MLVALAGAALSAAFGTAVADSPPKIILRPPAQVGGLPQIDGGARQDEADWPATLKYGAPGASFVCTATLVGERAVITAAHCLPPGAVSAIEFTPGKTVDLTCQRHPGYQGATLLFDLAMCLTGEAVRPWPLFAFERLDVDLGTIGRRARLFLLGYGCRDVDNPRDPDSVGQLYGGVATVDELPSEQGGHMITRGPDDVVICPGDSGGAAYRVRFADALPQIGDPRAIVGVNSGFIADGRVSAIAAFTPDMVDFIRNWATENGVSVCGLQPDARNCR